ncbi:amino acid racemase [Rhodobacterales bacterium HKCCSP123]|nr:amino acid racemase [Rhodobacterales bacterium HKCCSP123]
MRRVGILGGMGPEATVLLMSRVIAAVPARDDADHVPLIVDQNSQVPSRIAHLIEGTGPDPAPVLAAMARRLEGAGAEALAMPCNTAHHYLAAIRGAVSVPVLDMVAASARVARDAAGQGGKVGLLASPAVAKVGLFDRALAAEGLEVVHPADGAALLAAIRRIKAEGPVAAACAALLRASEAVLAQGAEVQLVACTEFSLIADALAPGVRGIDTLDVLVEEIVGFAQGRG